jgi:hypothetical protein
MVDTIVAAGPAELHRWLRQRLDEPALGRIQLLAGPRQVGKTTLLLAFEHAIHFEWLLSPIGHALSQIDGGRETGVLDPGAEAGRIARGIWSAVRMRRGEKRIVQRDQLPRGGPPADGSTPASGASAAA